MIGVPTSAQSSLVGAEVCLVVIAVSLFKSGREQALTNPEAELDRECFAQDYECRMNV